MLKFPLCIGSFFRTLEVFAAKYKKDGKPSDIWIAAIFLGDTYDIDKIPTKKALGTAKANVSKYITGQSHPVSGLIPELEQRIKDKYLSVFANDLLNFTKELRSALQFFISENELEFSCTNGKQAIKVNKNSFDGLDWNEDLLASLLAELWKYVLTHKVKADEIDASMLKRDQLEQFYKNKKNLVADKICDSIWKTGSTIYHNALSNMTAGASLEKKLLGQLSRIDQNGNKRTSRDIPCNKKSGLLLLKGDKYSGHTAHLLYKWDVLRQTKNSVVYYVPQLINNSEHLELFTFLYDTYIEKLITDKLIQMPDPPSNTLFNKRDLQAKAFNIVTEKLHAAGKQVLLFIDLGENTDPRFRSNIEEILRQTGSYLSKVFTVLPVPQDYQEDFLQACQPETWNIGKLYKGNVTKLLKEKGIEPDKVAPEIKQMLCSPYLLIKYLNAKNLGEFVTEDDEATVMDVIISFHIENETYAKILDEKLLPAITVATDKNENGIISQQQILDQLEALNLRYGTLLDSFEIYFRTPAEKIPFLFHRTRRNYQWEENAQIWRDYYFARGCFNTILSDQKDSSDLEDHIQTEPILSLYYSNKNKLNEQAQITVFRRLLFLTEMLQTQAPSATLRDLTKTHPQEWFRSYTALAMMCDDRGERVREAVFANHALDVYEAQKSNLATLLSDPRFPEYLCSMCYFVIKASPDENDWQRAADILDRLILKYGQDPSLQEEYGTLLIKAYGNAGAYYQRIKNYTEAEQRYLDRSALLDKLIGKYPSDQIPKELIDYKHQGFNQFAANKFHQKEYAESIRYHERSLEYGKQNNCAKAYLSYSRMVGTWIPMLDQVPDTWNIDNVKKLLHYLTDEIDLMKQMNISVDENERIQINSRKDTILERMKEHSIEEDDEIKECITAIEEA